MSEAASQLIQAFSALSPHERHSVLIELARIAESDDSGLSDDELIFGGEQIFAMYDAEEAQHGEAEAG
jgi:NADPH-dependent 7-cyano-7-deazaguanine reductase QueF-like protein